MKVNEKALSLVDLPEGWRARGFPMDPNIGEAQDFYAHPGVRVRLTRNLDKDRGFVNGAIGIVKKVLACDEDGCPYVFTVELSDGTMLLVHPIRHNTKNFSAMHLWICYDY